MRPDILAVVGTLSWFSLRNSPRISPGSTRFQWILALLSAGACILTSTVASRFGGLQAQAYIMPIALALAWPALWLSARGIALSSSRIWDAFLPLRTVAYLIVGFGLVWEAIHKWQVDALWLPLWVAFLFAQGCDIYGGRIRRRAKAYEVMNAQLIKTMEVNAPPTPQHVRVVEFASFRDLARGQAFLDEAEEKPAMKEELTARAYRLFNNFLEWMSQMLASPLVPRGRIKAWDKLLNAPETLEKPVDISIAPTEPYWRAFAGMVALHVGHLSEGIKRLRQAAEALESERLRKFNPRSIAVTRLALAMVLLQQGEIKDAWQNLASARNAAEQTFNLRFKCKILTGTAAMYGTVADYQRSLERTDEVRRLLARRPNDFVLGEALFYSAISHLMRRKNKEDLKHALEHALEAARIFHQWSTHWSKRIALGPIAYQFLQQTLGLLIKVLDSGAEEYKKEPSDWAKTWREAVSQPKYVALRPFLPLPIEFREAQAIWEKEENYQRHLRLLKPRLEIGDPTALLELGLRQKASGREAEAEATLAHAQTVADRSGMPDLAWRVRFVRGRLKEDDAQPQEALSFYEEAIERVERLRGAIGLEALATSFFGAEEKQELYARAVRLCVSVREWEKAFNYVEHSKSRSLVDKMAKLLSEVVPQDSKEEASLKKLRDRINELQAQRLMGRGTGQTAGLYQPSNEEVAALNAAYEEYEQALSQLRESNIERYSLEAVDALELSAVQKDLLDTETVLLEYFWNPGAKEFPPGLVAFIVSSEGIHVMPLEDVPKDEEGLKVFVEDCCLKLEKQFGKIKPPPKEGFFRAYEAFVAPFEEHLQGKRLIVVPHGPLHRLPVHALLTGESGKEAVLDWFEKGIVYAPSATALWYCRQKSKNHRPQSAAVIGDPTCALPPRRAEEAEMVAMFFGVTPYLRDAATRQCLQEISLEVDVLHISCHGLFRKGEPPLLASLVLAARNEKGEPVGDRFTAIDAYRLRLCATLVTLSACVSARMDFHPQGGYGEELYGLARGFFYAGTPSVIGNLWDADIYALRALMKHFYKAWVEENSDKATALRTAMLAVREEKKWSNPFYWGAPILIGSW